MAFETGLHQVVAKLAQGVRFVDRFHEPGDVTRSPVLRLQADRFCERGRHPPVDVRRDGCPQSDGRRRAGPAVLHLGVDDGVGANGQGGDHQPHQIGELVLVARLGASTHSRYCRTPPPPC